MQALTKFHTLTRHVSILQAYSCPSMPSAASSGHTSHHKIPADYSNEHDLPRRPIPYQTSSPVFEAQSVHKPDIAIQCYIQFDAEILVNNHTFADASSAEISITRAYSVRRMTIAVGMNLKHGVMLRLIQLPRD